MRVASRRVEESGVEESGGHAPLDPGCKSPLRWKPLWSRSPADGAGGSEGREGQRAPWCFLTKDPDNKDDERKRRSSRQQGRGNTEAWEGEGGRLCPRGEDDVWEQRRLRPDTPSCAPGRSPPHIATLTLTHTRSQHSPDPPHALAPHSRTHSLTPCP